MWKTLLKTSEPMKKIEHSVAFRTSGTTSRIASFEPLDPSKLPTRVLLVDDDPTFGKIMDRTALHKNIKLDYCRSFADFSSLNSWDYDVIIMDHDMGAVTGEELVSYVEESTTRDIPVILVSHTNRNDSQKWPGSIRQFVHKSLGPKAIFDSAVEAHEIWKKQKSLRQKDSNR